MSTYDKLAQFPVVAVIPIRAGSRGLPNKNIRLLLGAPLFQHSVDFAKRLGVDRIIVSTDIPEKDLHLRDESVDVVSRPRELCTDDAQMDDVLLHIVTQDIREKSTVILLQATSPLRPLSDATEGLKLLYSGSYDVVFPVKEVNRKVLKWGLRSGDEFVPLRTSNDCFENRQRLPPVYQAASGMYLFFSHWLRAERRLSAGRLGCVSTANPAAVDIDTLEDWETVESQAIAKQHYADPKSDS